MTKRAAAAEGTSPSAAVPSPGAGPTPGSRVLYLLSEYPVLSQTFVRNEIEGLRASGLTVHVAAVRVPADRSADAAYDVLAPRPTGGWVRANLALLRRRPRAYLAFLGMLVSLRFAGVRLAVTAVVPLVERLTRDGELAAVHTHFAWGATPLVLYAGALSRARTSVTVHANDIYRPVFELRTLLPRFRTLVTVCQYNVDFCERRGWAPRGMVIVPCGVEVPSTDGLPAPDPGLVVSVGRLVPKKGFLTLIEAFRSVVDVVPHARLDIIGDGPDRAVIEQRIADLGLGAEVRLRGAMAHTDVLSAVARSQVFALACEPEPDGSADALPVAIREAMARQRPVVSTDLAGVPEAVGDTGRIVAPGDSCALAAALTELLSEPDLAGVLGARARSRILDHATLSHTVLGMRTVFGADDADVDPGRPARVATGAR